MTIRAAFAGLFRPRGASASPARFLLSQGESGFTSGPATPTATTRPVDGLALLEARRLALLTEARRLKLLRKSKAASICERELRDVTHAILTRRLAENSPERMP